MKHYVIRLLAAALALSAMLCACMDSNEKLPQQSAGNDDISVESADETTGATQIEPPDILAIARDNHAYLFRPFAPEQLSELGERYENVIDSDTDRRTAAAFAALQQQERDWADIITKDQALEDVRFLMDYLQCAYAGYAYFGGAETFDPIRDNLLDKIEAMEEEIDPRVLAGLMQESLLPAITDSHFYVGWSDTDRRAAYGTSELFGFDGGEFVEPASGAVLSGISVDGERHVPDDILVPWLHPDGQLRYRLVVQGTEKPSVRLIFQDQEVESILQPLDVGGHPRWDDRRLWDLEEINGIPVLRCYILAPMADDSAEQFEAFARTGEALRDEPYLILDLRGNGGGNATHGSNWLSNLVGYDPSVFDGNEFHAIIFSDTVDAGDGRNVMGSDYSETLKRMKEAGEAPGYLVESETGLTAPLESDRTIFVLLDSGSASAAEYFAYYLSKVENTVLVGMPTGGCFHFGNVVSMSLPHSGIPVQCGAVSILLPDLELREGTGFAPDVWCNANNAEEAVLALIRRMEVQQD